ncbi:MAG: acyl-CoA dehydrogenase family protein, partial [Pseudomonadota bacterium]
MTDYRAPIEELKFALSAVAGIDRLQSMPRFAEATPELVDAVLDEAGKLAAEVFAPLNAAGDRQGVAVRDRAVRAPDGFADAYRQFVDGGWLSLAQDEAIGGQGLPFTLHMAVSEFWNSANLSLALCPMLSVSAIEALQAHATPALQQRFIGPLVSAEWTGTMNLTEPQAGSDLAAVAMRAVPEGDHYRLSGQKIYISWGDHDMADNILHMVLARLPDAPPGVRGISLFLVPKYLLNEDGSPGERNDVYPVSVEHKMGIHASPTCVMAYGESGEGALGYLVGEPNQGLACMFTMMNHARLEVGLEGVGLSERAYQAAAWYARDRKQGSAPGVKGQAPIIRHADVRRMLLTMRSLTEAARALALYSAAALDTSHAAEDTAERARAAQRLGLLTPVVKAWCTEIAQEVTSLGIQVFGGMGYVEETGVAQYFRDARITPIYEGTNGIQALDLVMRKVGR